MKKLYTLFLFLSFCLTDLSYAANHDSLQCLTEEAQKLYKKGSLQQITEHEISKQILNALCFDGFLEKDSHIEAINVTGYPFNIFSNIMKGLYVNTSVKSLDLSHPDIQTISHNGSFTYYESKGFCCEIKAFFGEKHRSEKTDPKEPLYP